MRTRKELEKKNLEDLIQNLKWHISRCESGEYFYSREQYEGDKYMLDYYKKALINLEKGE